MTAATLHPSGATRSARVALLPIVGAALLGVWVSIVGMRGIGPAVIQHVSERPEGPVLLLLRGVLLALSVWIGGTTLVALFFQLIGLRGLAARTAGLLPSALGSLVKRAAGIGLVGSLLLPGVSAMAATKATPTTRPAGAAAAATPQRGAAAEVSTRRVVVDASSGQRWPVISDLPPLPTPGDAPVLSFESGPSATTTVPATTVPAAPGPIPTSTPSSASTSIVAGAVVSIPQGPAGSEQPSAPPTGLASGDQASPPVAPLNVAVSPARQHTVKKGEYYWSIARAEVRRRDPGAHEADVAKYARMVIQANKSKYASRSNPFLLYAGDIIDLP
jgi:LysM repeat protein